MPPQRSFSCSSLRARSRGTAEVRRASPPRRSGSPGIAGEVRQLLASVCASPTGDASACDLSTLSTDRAGLRGQAATSRAVLHSNFNALAERINAVISGQQRQTDADRRRLSQLERRVESRLDDSLRDSLRENDGREKWAEIQGCVRGLIEETQALARRVDGLDERLWARTGGTEVERQRHRDLEQQVQALDQQSRLHAAAAEETQKRQVTRLCRAEHGLEEFARRLARCEEEQRTSQGSHRQQGHLEARVVELEQQQGQWAAKFRGLQSQLEEGLLRGAADVPCSEDDVAPEQASRVEEAMEATERSLAALDKRVSKQLEEQAAAAASMRVRSEGQAQRLAALAERLEAAHGPALEALRSDVAQGRAQDRREADGELVRLRAWVSKVVEEGDEATAAIREELRQVHVQLASLALRPAESPVLRKLEERVGAQEREVSELRARLERLPAACLEPSATAAGGPEVTLREAAAEEEAEDLAEDLGRRLEWLEEQSSLGAATEKADQKRLAQVQEKICELVEQVSRLSQRTSSGEASCAALQQHLQQLQGQLERRHNEDAAPQRALATLDLRCGAMAKAVAEVEARLLEVEGGLQFSRERGSALSSGEVERPKRVPDRGEQSGSLLEIQGKLLEVAAHLEAYDELAERVMVLERRLPGGGACGDAAPQLGAGGSGCSSPPDGCEALSPVTADASPRLPGDAEGDGPGSGESPA